jgi:23S rRNA G2445 N2-methylase RlmL
MDIIPKLGAKMMAEIPFFALTTRGLEFVSLQEISAVRGVSGVESAYRRVAGQIDGSPSRLLNLRTVDDVYIAVDTWHNISHERSMLPVFAQQAKRLSLAAVVDLLQEFRHFNNPPVFSVTASFVGKRNYTSDEIKQAVAAGISPTFDWMYTADDREADLNVRLFIEHELAYVGVRLARHALHERPYKSAHVAGSLKPSVAAALLMLAGAAPSSYLLDPFCGAGTILSEARTLGYRAIGGDLSLDALAAASANSPDTPLVHWDAGLLPLRENSCDAVVSNLPWGRQVTSDIPIVRLYSRTLMELWRILKPHHLMVLLTHQLLPDMDGFEVIQRFEISLFGQTPVVAVLRAE